MSVRVLIAICVLLATATALPSAPAPSATTRTSRPTVTIPPGYTYYTATGSSYKYHHGPHATWEGANVTCLYEGGHLVVLNDAVEAKVVADIVRDATGIHHFIWSGLRDNRPAGVMDWRTVRGQPVSEVYNVWDEGHPKDNSQWTCALYEASTKRLVDAPCDYNYYFICEIPQ